MPRPPLPPDEEEALCRRCGLCCHEKIAVDGVVVITDIPCRFLDTATKLCRVYPERAKHQPHCASARKAAAIGALPGDCPYVADIPDYRAPVLLADAPEYEALVATLFKRRPATPDKG